MRNRSLNVATHAWIELSEMDTPAVSPYEGDHRRDLPPLGIVPDSVDLLER